MGAFKNILVVMDLPRQRQLALDRGLALARRYGARLHLASFVHHEMYDQKDVFDTQQRKSVREGLESERKRWLSERVRDADTDGVDLTSVVVWEKNIHDWIAGRCGAGDFDLIVKSAHNSKTLVHTPTDWHLLREVSVPVMIVTASKWSVKPVVIAAVDPAKKSRAHQRMNQSIVEAATEFAGTHGADVHLAWTVQAPEVLADLDVIDPVAYRKQLIDTMRPRLLELAEKYDIPAKRIHTPNGKPDVALSGLAAKLRAEVIVLSMAGRTGLAGRFIGNTAEKVLTGARCDLLAIKP